MGWSDGYLFVEDVVSQAGKASPEAVCVLRQKQRLAKHSDLNRGHAIALEPLWLEIIPFRPKLKGGNSGTKKSKHSRVVDLDRTFDGHPLRHVKCTYPGM